jgi:hypothetical protein
MLLSLEVNKEISERLGLEILYIHIPLNIIFGRGFKEITLVS